MVVVGADIERENRESMDCDTDSLLEVHNAAYASRELKVEHSLEVEQQSSVDISELGDQWGLHSCAHCAHLRKEKGSVLSVHSVYR